MMKVLVLGASGMAGHVITTYLEESSVFEVYSISRSFELNDKTSIIDVSNLSEFNAYLESMDFDVIINCIGILNWYAELNKDKAVLLNGHLPHFLEYKYQDSFTKIIHLSTDCVFSGNSGNYTENSFKDGDSFYDRTKAIGEIRNDKDLTFRMSIVGPDMNYTGIGLFNWFMNSEGTIDGYSNAIWTGVTTIQLAKAIRYAIFTNLTGLYHLVPKSKINKYELLILFRSIFDKKDLVINKNETVKIDKSLINTRTDFDYPIPSYEEMVTEMKNWIEAHKDFYPHYL